MDYRAIFANLAGALRLPVPEGIKRDLIALTMSDGTTRQFISGNPESADSIVEALRALPREQLSNVLLASDSARQHRVFVGKPLDYAAAVNDASHPYMVPMPSASYDEILFESGSGDKFPLRHTGGEIAYDPRTGEVERNFTQFWRADYKGLLSHEQRQAWDEQHEQQYMLEKAGKLSFRPAEAPRGF